MIACQMTLDLFEIKKEDLIDGVELGGAVTALEVAGQSNINYFM